MAKTKRPPDASGEEAGRELSTLNDDMPEPTKKKPKSEKTASSGNPMERKKKRKELDKERHRVPLTESRLQEVSEQTSTATPTEDRVAIASTSASASSSLPEFHISVFGDLASADYSTRASAVETLVRELEEVQKAYERLGRKEVVEGEVKLEAEKDDGLDSCAPSLRYAVRRLIRGVSSSREVK